MLVINNETNNVLFRGKGEKALRVFGDGTFVNEVFEDEELVATETSTLTLVYEDTNEDQLQYLADTDWYVTREAETGTAMPADVSAKRAEARTAIV
jgi:hypothetical protein